MARIRTEYILSEAAGCFFLTMAYCMNGYYIKNNKDAALLGPFAIAATLACLGYGFYGYSYTHFNPAISVGFLVARRYGQDDDLIELLIGCAAQCGGALGGGFFVYAMMQYAYVFEPGHGFEWWQVMVFEAVFSGLLAICYFGKYGAWKGTAGAMAAPLLAALILGGPISGACLNPAVAVGTFCTRLITDQSFDFPIFITYFSMPFAGAAAGAVVFRLVRDYDSA